MASLHTYSAFIILIVLIVQPWYATSNIFSPIIDSLCKEIECGKGTCKRSQNATFGFACECDVGWKQASLAHLDDLMFLPCVVPNCTLNFTCLKTQFPFPPATGKPSTSVFNPCHWIDCGGGTCNRTSLFKYRCECREGFYNLQDHAGFPCYKQCALGNNCSKLGIKTPTSSQQISATTPRKEGNIKWSIFGALSSILGVLVLVI